jgi:arylsulfatase A-like enzyme
MQKEVIQFIKANKDQPFFMYYASPIPHAPLQAPKRWVDYYVQKFGDEEPYLGERNYFPHRYPHACYAAMVSYFDEQVGEIVAALKDLGLLENTLIIFSAATMVQLLTAEPILPGSTAQNLLKAKQAGGKEM